MELRAYIELDSRLHSRNNRYRSIVVLVRLRTILKNW